MKAVPFIILILIVAGCSTIHSSFNQQIDYNQYKSFCWLEGCQFTYTGPEYLNDSIIQNRVKEAIIDNLQKKGLTYTDQEPDLLVDFHITIENEKVITYHNREDEPYYYRMTFMQPEELILTKGTIIIHMVDHKTSEVVWQSQALGYLESTPDLSEKNIRRGITKLLKNYPPKKQ